MFGPYNKKSQGALRRLSFFKILLVSDKTVEDNILNATSKTVSFIYRYMYFKYILSIAI